MEKVKDLEVDFELVKGKTTILKQLISVVKVLELESKKTFTHPRVKQLKLDTEIVFLKKAVRAILWLEDSSNTKKFNIK